MVKEVPFPLSGTLGELFCSGVFERPISVGHRLYAGGIKFYALPFRTGNLRCTKYRYKKLNFF